MQVFILQYTLPELAVERDYNRLCHAENQIALQKHFLSKLSNRAAACCFKMIFPVSKHNEI